MPSDRWLNLIYYFATRNADKEGKDKFDASMRQVESEWVQMHVQKALSTRASVAEPEAAAESATPLQQRQRKLPPMPAWYGSRERATTETMAAKNMLMKPKRGQA